MAVTGDYESNVRYDPFNNVWAPVTITAEPHTIALLTSPAVYGIRLIEAPLFASPSTMTIYASETGGQEFIEVPFTRMPALGNTESITGRAGKALDLSSFPDMIPARRLSCHIRASAQSTP